PTGDFVVLTDQFIVQFKAGVSQEQIEALHAEHAVKVLTESPYKAHLQLVSVTNSTNGDALSVSNLYNESPLVAFAHPNFIHRPAARQASFIPNDPLFWRQWHLRNSGVGGGTPGADISADRAWAIEKGSAQTVIAVLDGGFDMGHLDLRPNLWHNPGE